MKPWTKKSAADSVKECIMFNTGLSESEIVSPKRDPEVHNLNAVASKIKEFIVKKIPLNIFGDYDADGVTASSILYLAITAFDPAEKVTVRLPKRFSEGFGISMIAIDEFEPGAIITVDNGIAAVDQIKYAKEKGFQVVVTDHHLTREDGLIPEADVILDPNMEGDPSEYHGYCGAGVALRVAKTLLGKDHELIPYLTALAAIGTVADVMDLTGDNHNIVKDGLYYMNRGVGGGIEALLQELGISGYVSEDDIGFKIGPVINASGRMYDNGASIPFELLTQIEDFRKAETIAKQMVETNEMRKSAVKEGVEKAHQIIADNCLYGESPLVIAGEFHEGIVGIIAGRITEEMNVPSIVLAKVPGKDLYKGSGRSVDAIHLKNLLDTAADLMVTYGGHAGACGLTVAAENLSLLQERLMENIPDVEITQEEYKYDMEISTDEIDFIYSELEKYAPFGHGNPKLIFKINNYNLVPRYGKFSQKMGDGSIIKLFGQKLDAIGFGLADLYDAEGEPKSMTVIGSLGYNAFNGKRSAQLEMLDLKKVIKANPSSLMGVLKAKMTL